MRIGNRVTRSDWAWWLILAILPGSQALAPGYAVAGSHPSPDIIQADVEVNPEDVTIEADGDYQHITMQNAALDRMREHVGDPQLPVVVKWFVLPPDRTIADVQITPVAKVTIPGNYRPFPILDEDNGDSSPPDQPDWPEHVYPRLTGGLVLTGQNRIYRMAKVAFYPLEYRPDSGELTLLSTVNVRLVLRPLTAAEQGAALNIARPYAVDGPFGGHRTWIRDTVLNPQDLETHYERYEHDGDNGHGGPDHDKSTTPGGSFVSKWPSRDGLAVPYVIITNDTDEDGSSIGSMTDAMATWATTLHDFGIQAVVVTVDAIDSNGLYAGFDRPMRIRNFIKDAVENWGTSYVLLAGDVSVVPTRRVGGEGQGQGPNDWSRPDPMADYWYTRIGEGVNGASIEALWNNDADSWIGENSADIAGDQNVGVFSSLYLGRLPARNSDEASVMVGKTMRYLLFPPYANQAATGGFYNKATVAAGPTNSTNPLNDASGIHMAETEVIPKLVYTGSPWQIRRLYPNVAGAQGNCTPPNPPLAMCFPELYTYIVNAYLPGSPDYWDGDDLRDALDSGGTHVLYHYDHSNRNQLGPPSCPCTVLDCQARTNTQCPNMDRAACCSALQNSLSSINPFDLDQARALTNASSTEARYFFAFSNGSWTNMADMNSISEALMRAPNGGAVGYIGNSVTNSGGASAPAIGLTFRKLFDTRETATQWTQAWYEAVDELSWNSWDETRLMCQVPQLGDPFLWPWRGTPVGISLTVSPTPIPVGTPTVTVTARRADTQALLAGVVVCLRQGTWTYATATTNASGQAVFPGVQIQGGITPVQISGLLPGFKPSQITAAVGGGALVVYSRHTVSDCVTGGDCDGVLEAGETVAVNVTLQNRGTQATAEGTAALRPSAGMNCELKLNGQYRPSRIILGASSATAPADADSFRIPLVQKGTRMEGVPSLPGPGEYFRVWRADASGVYTIAMSSSSASQDTVFSGVIHGEGGITSVQKTGERNDMFVTGGDSLSFSFRGDASEDRLTFRAEAPTWVTISTATALLPALQPGDSTTVSFVMTVLKDIPDQQNLYFTVSAAELFGQTAYSHSDFALSFARPEVDLVFLDREFGDFGCPDTTWRWMPAIKNFGTGQADSVVLHLRKVSGTMDIVDSLATFVNVGPDGFGSGDPFLVCGGSIADTANFSAVIDEEVFHRTLLYTIPEGGGGCHGSTPLAAPENVWADLGSGTVILRWTPVETAAGYQIEYTTDPNATGGTYLDRVGTESLRYQVHADLVAPGENGGGYDVGYYFFVRACHGNYCFYRKRVGPIYPWVRERTGWPKLLPESSVCAPSVTSLGGGQRAIIAATDRIYGFRADGTPLNPNGSAVLFDPGLAVQQPGQQFVQALATGCLTSSCADYAFKIAGNLYGSGTYFVGVKDNAQGQCCIGELICKGSQYSHSAPMVHSDLESYDSLKGTLLAGSANGAIYSWDATLNGPSNQVCEGRVLANSPDGSTYNYQSLAIPKPRLYDTARLIAITRSGRLLRYNLQYLNQVHTPWANSDLSDGFLSTPVTGDIDGDGADDVVVTTLWGGSGPDTLFVLDDESWVPKVFSPVVGNGWHFRRSGSDEPPSGPTLADLDGDCEHEIVVAGYTAGGIDGAETFPRTLTVHVFDYSGDPPHLTEHSATADIPYNYRNVTGVYPIGSPIVADFDYSGTYKPDILVTANNGAIYAFEYDPQSGTVSPKLGWPLLLPDVAREPVLCRLDSQSEQYSLVVQCQDGWLHVYDLPTAGYAAPAALTWNSYGYDGGNSRGVPPACPPMPRTAGAAGFGRPRPSILSVGPIPTQDQVEIRLATRGYEPILIEVLDVSGRLVRHIDAGPAQTGTTQVVWDGRDDAGGRVSSGVYWCLLRSPGGDQRRKLVVLR